MMESNYRTGIYTSPHLFKFNERIQVNGVDIIDDEIIEIYLLLKEKALQINATFFEITTVMAFEYFRRKQVDIAIIETGMGGRFDSTNIINPVLSIIVSIGIDHVEYLGNNIRDIAKEKAGILKKDIPALFRSHNNEINEIIGESAKQEGALLINCHEFKRNKVEVISFNQNLSMKLRILYDGTEFIVNLPLLGLHQIDNLYLVLSALKICGTNFPNINQNSITSGLEKTKVNTNLMGRLHVINKNPYIIIDGAHNLPAISSDLKAIETAGHNLEEFEIIFSCMEDKDIFSMMKEISNYNSSISLIELEEQRGARINQLLKVAENRNFAKINLHKIRQVLDKINEKKSKILLIGSFYLVAEILDRLAISNK